MSRVVEMRTYTLKPDKREEFLRVFREKSIPAHESIGMKVVGPFLSIEKSGVFFFMRIFPDLARRNPMKEAFYEGQLWKSELEHVLMPMIESYDAVVVDDPDNLLATFT